MVKFTDSKGKTHKLTREQFIKLMKHLKARAKANRRQKAIDEMVANWN